MTSSFEGYPLSTLESMGRGCPVVSYDIKYGPREQITDGVDGFLVPPGDTELLAQRVIELLRSTRARRAHERRGARAAPSASARRSSLARWAEVLEHGRRATAAGGRGSTTCSSSCARLRAVRGNPVGAARAARPGLRARPGRPERRGRARRRRCGSRARAASRGSTPSTFELAWVARRDRRGRRRAAVGQARRGGRALRPARDRAAAGRGRAAAAAADLAQLVVGDRRSCGSRTASSAGRSRRRSRKRTRRSWTQTRRNSRAVGTGEVVQDLELAQAERLRRAPARGRRSARRACARGRARARRR